MTASCANCTHTLDFHMPDAEIESFAIAVGESSAAIRNEIAIGVWKYEGETERCKFPDCGCTAFEVLT